MNEAASHEQVNPWEHAMSPDRMLHLAWKHAFGPLLVVMNCHFLVLWMDVDCLTAAQLEAYDSPFPAYTSCYFFLGN